MLTDSSRIASRSTRSLPISCEAHTHTHTHTGPPEAHQLHTRVQAQQLSCSTPISCIHACRRSSSAAARPSAVRRTRTHAHTQAHTHMHTRRRTSTYTGPAAAARRTTQLVGQAAESDDAEVWMHSSERQHDSRRGLDGIRPQQRSGGQGTCVPRHAHNAAHAPNGCKHHCERERRQSVPHAPMR